MTNTSKRQISSTQKEELLRLLKNRFEKNMHRHEKIAWSSVQSKLEGKAETLWSLNEMENTGGEPDVVSLEKGSLTFYDCSKESPSGRRSLCFDREAWIKRKEHKPKGNVMDAAAAMGVTLLTEAEYRALQAREHFDATTSSWVQTPSAIRKLGGALFCDYRYGTVFTYHNGAESYYAARGFRGSLRV